MTVHFVDEGVDTGPIVLQEALELSYPARIAEIEERVHGVEHRLLPRAVRLIAAGRVRPDPDNPRRCWSTMAIESRQGRGERAGRRAHPARAAERVGQARAGRLRARARPSSAWRSSRPAARPPSSPAAGIETRAVEDYTGFPEMLDGRVKTLNPRIYAGPAGGPLGARPRRHAQRARDRADRPGLREPLSVRGACRRGAGSRTPR